jgi:hypothetical protein
VQVGGDEKAAEWVVDVLAVWLERWVDLFLGEVQSVSPVDVSALQQGHLGVFRIVLLLKGAIAKTGVDHERNIIKIKRVRDGMFRQQNLLLILAQLLRNLIQINNTIIDRFLIIIILRNTQPFRYWLQTFL